MTDRDTMTDQDNRTLTVTEPGAVPWLSVVFGYGPMLPFAAGAAAAWWLGGTRGGAWDGTWGGTRGETWGGVMLSLTTLWGCAILLFLSGVRRGLSFRTEGGPTWVQIATMLGLFLLGFSALVLTAGGAPGPALVLLIVGFTGIAVLDPIAARRGEAPLFFARLRPLQIPIAIVSLCALLALTL
ncbi:DUF3429 domain-containing protein [Methylobacterium sp.]|uniref:DUF3429 domain-containing protein n=1 Tax=Methylobacterium sp. TaxID=409 RepID=UPI00351DCE54